MISPNNEEQFTQNLGQHANSSYQPLTKREQRQAEKAAKRAAKDAAKQAKKAAKAAEKQAKKDGGMMAAPMGQPMGQPMMGQPTMGQPAMGQPMPTQAMPTQQPRSGLEGLPTIAPEGQTGVYEPLGGNAYGQEQDAFSRYSRYNVEQGGMPAPAPKRKRNRGTIVAAVLIVLACLIGVGFAGANIYLDSLNRNLAGDAQEAEEVKEVLTGTPIGDEPFYMMLIGCDDREGVDGARSDTNILTRFDPKKNKVTMLSIPRDTAIQIEGHGMQKFNAAYTYGGASGTIEAAQELCGVDIAHYAEVHFEALIDIIDYIGGVDVDVPIEIDDVDAGGKVPAGMQHLDGEHAMIFARSRSYVTGDFQRTTSQRLLIEAAAKKVLSMNPAEYPGLLMKISECMNTDFSVQELLGLAQAFTDEPELKMYSALLPCTTEMIDEISYVIADEENLAKMMKLIDKGKNPAKLKYEDSTVTSSKEAKKEGIEVIVNYGDDAEAPPAEEEYYDEGYDEEDYVDYDEGDEGYEEDADYEEDEEAADDEEAYDEQEYEE